MYHTWITRYVVLICGVGLFTLGGALSWFDKTASALVTYGFAVLCLFYVFLPEFKRFKGFGVEAELLEKKIEEADRLLRQLRHLTTPMAEVLFTVVARMGRWDSMVPRKDRHRTMEAIESQLIEIGVTPNVIDNAKKDWHKFNIFDMALPLYRAVYEKITVKMKSKDDEIGAFPQPIPAGSLDFQRIIDERKAVYLERDRLEKCLKASDFKDIPGELERFIKESQALSPEERDDIFQKFNDSVEDLSYYLKHNKFRRLEHWLSEKDS